jgi:hypothetical protein
LIETRVDEHLDEPAIHRARVRKHPPVLDRFGGDEFPEDPDGARGQFIRALACWHASRDFQDWIESGQYERRWRTASTLRDPVCDLGNGEYSKG